MVKHEHDLLALEAVNLIEESVKKRFPRYEKDYYTQEDLKNEWYGIIVTALEHAEEMLNND